MNKKKWLKILATAVLTVGVYLLIYYLMDSGTMSRSWQTLVVRMCYNIVLAVSLNLVVGYLGELSLGHAGFYAIGAYIGCLVAIQIEGPIALQFIAGLLTGGVAAAIGGFLISSSILRLKGDYLAIVTLAFGEIIRSFVKIIPGFGGTTGLSGVPSFGSRKEAFTWSFVIVVITLLLIHNFAVSRHGRTVTAIRDNAIAATSVGISIKRYKILVFTVAAFFAGMAGVMFGFFKTNVEPNDFNYNVSIEILVMVVLGGMGSLKGSVIAACIITALPEVLRGADEYRLLIYAIALILMMLLNSSPRFVAFRRRLADGARRLRARLVRRGGREKGEV